MRFQTVARTSMASTVLSLAATFVQCRRAAPPDPPRDDPRAMQDPDAGSPMAVLRAVGNVQCRVPVPGTDCNRLPQQGTMVEETQVATAPPVPTAGWYPGGNFVLTAATVYTGSGGASGPNGVRYAASMQVHGTGSIDAFTVIQTQEGCPTVTYRFSGDTFGTTTAMRNVSWACPACPDCGRSLPYSGTTNGITVYFRLPNGNTLAQVFTHHL